MPEAVKVVNFTKSRALNSCLFSELSEMGSDYIQLLLPTELRWVSRGRMHRKLFKLYLGVQLFSMETDFELCNRLTNELPMTVLAY